MFRITQLLIVPCPTKIEELKGLLESLNIVCLSFHVYLHVEYREVCDMSGTRARVLFVTFKVFGEYRRTGGGGMRTFPSERGPKIPASRFKRIQNLKYNFLNVSYTKKYRPKRTSSNTKSRWIHTSTSDKSEQRHTQMTLISSKLTPTRKLIKGQPPTPLITSTLRDTVQKTTCISA